MTRRRLTDILTLFLGALYILAGIAETTRAIGTGDGGVPFWFGSLVGGGTLILVGTLAFRHRPRLCASLVTVGCGPRGLTLETGGSERVQLSPPQAFCALGLSNNVAVAFVGADGTVKASYDHAPTEGELQRGLASIG